MMRRAGEITINEGWRFRYESDDWQTVTLPHTWNALDTMSTDSDWHYRRGVGIYEKTIAPDTLLPNLPDTARLWLAFEAVAQVGRVYFDDVLLTTHHGGYTAFTIEIPNRAGVLRVEADNTPNIDVIPSDRSDFFLYGGITRNVWLYATGQTYIESLHCDTDVTPERGIVTVRGRIASDLRPDTALKITLTASGDDAPLLHEQSLILEENDFVVTLPAIMGDDYRLWSPDTPALYEVHVSLADDLPGAVHQSFGFRTFDFPAHDGFYLNGERLLLHGTHRHEDWAGHGGAVPDELTRHEFQMIKDAGFNFVRLGHYPQSRAALHACDELGLIVWEEIPWCRGGIGGEVFKQHTRAMLREMITQHRQHPSIIFWGLGNELDWKSDHPDSTDEHVCEFLRELHELAHDLDPTRLTALRRFDVGAAIVDVYSPSIWAGWYRGKYTDYEQNLRAALHKYPRLLHAEWGGDSHAGRYAAPPHIPQEPISTVDNAEETGTATSDEGFTRYSKDGDWSESYILSLMDHHLHVQQSMENFAGSLQWVFKDFGTPLRPYNPVPYVNQKGLLDRSGRPKDNYYLFQAWQTDTPVLACERWSNRTPADRCIRIISNMATVHVKNDGRKHERELLATLTRSTDSRLLSFTLPDDTSFERIRIQAGDEMQQLLLRMDASDVSAAGYRLMLVQSAKSAPLRLTLQLTDGDEWGADVIADERRVCFEVLSGGRLRKHRGYMGGSDVIETANGYAWVQITLDDAADALMVRADVEGIGTIERTFTFDDT